MSELSPETASRLAAAHDPWAWEHAVAPSQIDCMRNRRMHLYARQALSRTRTADEDRPSQSFGWQPVLCVSNLLLRFRCPSALDQRLPVPRPKRLRGVAKSASVLTRVRLPRRVLVVGDALVHGALHRLQVAGRRRADAHQQSDTS